MAVMQAVFGRIQKGNFMEKVDLTKLNVAIRYVERIADGCNPVNNTPLETDDVLNNQNIIRCMYFIKEVLEEVRRNDGVISGRKAKAEAMPFPVEVLDEFEYQEDKSITHVLRQIFEPVADSNVKKMSAVKINTLLLEDGYLAEEENPGTGKTRKVVTPQGKELGIYMMEREFNGRVYEAVMYNKNAQEYVVKRIRKLTEAEQKL